MTSRVRKRPVSSTVSSNVNSDDSIAFKYDELLRLLSVVRMHYLKYHGKELKTDASCQWSTFHRWVVRFSYKDVIDASDSGVTSKERATFEDVPEPHAKYFNLFARYFLVVCTKFEKNKNEGSEGANETPVVLPTTRAQEKQFILKVMGDRAMLSQVYKYAARLLPYNTESQEADRRAYDMFMVLSERLGATTTVDSDPVGTFKVLPNSLLAPKKYFDTAFFNGDVPARAMMGHSRNCVKNGKVQFPPFMILLKLALDCKLLETILESGNTRPAKRKKGSSSSSVASTSTGLSRKYTYMYKNTCMFVEVMFYAWSRLATYLNVDEAEDILAPFIFCDSRTGTLQVVEEVGRCLPDDCMKKLYTFYLPATEGEEDEDEVTVDIANLGVPFSHETAPPLLRGMEAREVELFRGFARDFISDLYGFVGNPSLFWKKEKAVFLNDPALTKYSIPEGDELPSRFEYTNSTITEARRAITAVRMLRESETRRALSESGGDEGDMTDQGGEDSSTSGGALSDSTGADVNNPLLVAQASIEHHCEQDPCNCDDLRDEILGEVDSYARVLHTKVKNFYTEATSGAPFDTALMQRAQLVLADPPYEVRFDRDHSNSDYDQLSERNMTRTVTICEQVLRPGGHVVLFCSADQFPEWKKKFVKPDRNGLPSGKFDVTPVPILFIPERGAESRVPYHRTLTHKNCADYAFHAVKKHEGMEEAMKQVSWSAHGYVHSSVPPIFNVVDGVPRFAPGERILVQQERGENDSDDETEGHDSNPGTTGSRNMARAEQKNLALIMELIMRYTQPGDVVVDMFAGTCTTGVACMSLLDHRLFIGGDSDARIVDLGQKRILDSFIVNAVRGHTPGGVHVTDELMEAMKTVYRRNKYGIANRFDGGSTNVQHLTSSSSLAHVKLRRTQRLPALLHGFLANALSEKEFMSGKCRATGPDRWTPRLFGLLSSYGLREVRSMLASVSNLYVDECAAVRRGTFVETTTTVRTTIAVGKDQELGTIGGLLIYGTWQESTRGNTIKFSLGPYSVERNEFANTAIPVVDGGSRLVVPGDQNGGDMVFSKVYMAPCSLYPLANAKTSSDESECNAVLRIRSKKKMNMSDITSRNLVRVFTTSAVKSNGEIVIFKK